MPLFAAYGLLTALMTALAATLSVLASVLVLITRDRELAEVVDLDDGQYSRPDQVDHVSVATFVRVKVIPRKPIT